MEIKTLDVNFKEWFDKTWGNSYNAGSITFNFGMEDAKTINFPYEYGYGDYYLQRVTEYLFKNQTVPCEKYEALWVICKNNNIILRHNIARNCKKRDLMVY